MRFWGALLLLIGLVLSCAPRRNPANQDLSFAEQLDRENAEALKILLERAHEFRGLELVSIGPGEGLATKFGHILLRFVGDPQSWTEDVTLSFIIEADPELPMKYLKTITGGYPLGMELRRFGYFWRHYVVTQGRHMERHVLLSTPEQRKKLAELVVLWNSDRSRYLGQYTFLDENCAGVLSELLREAGFPYPENIDVSNPRWVDNYFRRIGILPYPALSMKTYESVYQKVERLRKIYPKESLTELAKRLSDEEVKELIEFDLLHPGQRRVLIKRHPYAPNTASFEEVLGHPILPDEAYSYCVDRDCVSPVVETFKGLNFKKIYQFPVGYRKIARTSRKNSGFEQVPIQWMGMREKLLQHETLFKEYLKQTR